jgi:hypothetical protein
MKYILFLAILTISCKKEADDRICWYCLLGNSPGGQPNAPRTVCLEPWEKLEDVDFVDSNNNDLTSYCEKR